MADEVTALLIAAQAPDGYLDTAFQVTGHERYRNLADEHEIYCMGHLIEAGLAHAPLLPVARRVADHLVATFTDQPGFCGHPEAELALVKLYRATGERAYLELARRFVDRRGHGTLPQRYGSSAYLVDRVPVREQTVVEGHCVRQLYLNCGATDVFTELGEPLDPLLAAWADMVDGKTYITGGVGSDRAHEAFGAPFEIAPASAYAETCAAIASVFWNWRLLQATGEVRFADLLERTLYNGVLVGVAFDRSEYSYWNTLHGTPDRRPWFDCACCPPNLMRLLASLHTYLATEDDRRRADDPPVRDRHGRRAFACARSIRGRAGSRSTPIARSACASRPGARTRGSTAGRSRPGTSTPSPASSTLDLDMSLRVIEPDPRVASIRGDVAFERGPFVLCLEEGTPRAVRVRRARAARVDPSEGQPAERVGGVGALDGQRAHVAARQREVRQRVAHDLRRVERLGRPAEAAARGLGPGFLAAPQLQQVVAARALAVGQRALAPRRRCGPAARRPRRLRGRPRGRSPPRSPNG